MRARIKHEWERSFERFGCLKIVKGKLLFNTYADNLYEARHLAKLKRLMEAGKVPKPYLEFEAPWGLDNLHKAVGHYRHKKATLWNLMLDRRSSPEKNRQREKELKEIDNLIKKIQKLYY